MDTKRDYIKHAFSEDEDIFKYFDPSCKVSSIDEVVDNILGKIKEHESMFDCKFIGLESGYVFICKEPNLLISFGINKNNRNKDNLLSVWSLILEELGGFDCFLWSINTRAIKWLQRMGMEVVDEYVLGNNYITKLNYTQCL